MARKISYQQAVAEAIAAEMERDETVVIMGEDIAGGMGAPGEQDAWGGVLGVTKGLYSRFPGRVLDTPISESAFISAAIGAADGGMRPRAGQGRDRRGARWPAPRRRADVHRVQGGLLRPDLQPGREVPVHVRGQG